MARDDPEQPVHLFDPEAILATLKRHAVEFVVIEAYAAVTRGWSEPTGDTSQRPTATSTS